MTFLELTAAAFGILGTLLLALNGKRAGWGFVAFLASNAGWIAFAIDQNHLGLLAQNLVFTATSGLGAWLWLVKPRRRTESDAGETVVGPGDLYTELLAAHARIRELEQAKVLHQDFVDAECFREAGRMNLIGPTTRASLREYVTRFGKAST